MLGESIRGLMGGNLLIVDSCSMQGVLTLHGDHG